MKITISFEMDDLEQAKTLLDSAGLRAARDKACENVSSTASVSLFKDVSITPRKELAERAASIILSERGRLVLSLFKKMAVCRAADFNPLFTEAGYSGNSSAAVLHELLEAGAIVRMKRGVYRLPLPQEVMQQPA